MTRDTGTDWAVRILRGALMLFLLLIGFGVVAMALITVAAGVDPGLFAEIAGQPRDISPTNAYLLFLAAMAGGIVLLLLAVDFVRKLLAVLNSVRAGDPFVPANAVRLHAMARLMLVIVVGGFVLELYAHWIDKRHAVSIGIDSGNPASGLLLVLVLFVLARVFAQGTAMRDDLEGTV
ncbi:DUF2975 domain-containing protein [Stakelama tenebrarum]|uniref:DUF2975 domain-containing protein n=1 Tax=Stakelama tenebrarum TaxID=2711215 RepID=A0A6G6Y967_9SPHN|nr:DUF2975 domain-containing protein [Sphingosinithalassobacter tenebrarum]QIG81347.1 DUF2975 domain-containing protein [Sphingosinithalassobacter tenebrarum]